MKDLIRSRETFALAFLTALSVFVIDRLTKIFFTRLLDLWESLPVIKNVFHFTLVHNTGIAFGLFKNQGIVFVIIPLVVVILIIFNLYYSRHHPEVDWLYVFAFALILGGALGNLTDRILYGYVIDFIDWRIWPVFNMADSAITIGTVILLKKCIPSFAK